MLSLTLTLVLTPGLGLISCRDLLLLVDEYNATVATSASKKMLEQSSVSMGTKYNPRE